MSVDVGKAHVIKAYYVPFSVIEVLYNLYSRSLFSTVVKIFGIHNLAIIALHLIVSYDKETLFCNYTKVSKFGNDWSTTKQDIRN